MRIIGFRIRRQILRVLRISFHQRNQGLTLKCRGQRETEHAKKSGCYVNQAHTRTHAMPGQQFSRQLHDERNVNSLVIKKNSMHTFAMRAE